MIAILLIPSWANSQNVGRFNLNDQTYISIEVNPKVEGFTNMQVLFGKEWVLDWFANDLEDCNKKIQKWTKVAQKESVTDVSRTVKGVEKLTFDYVVFTYNGQNYVVEGRTTYVKAFGLPSFLTEPIDNLSKPYFKPYFSVDKSGNCYLYLDCDIKEVKAYTNSGNDNVGVGAEVVADNNGNAAAGVSANANSSRGIEYVNPVGSTVIIPVSEIQSFIDKLRAGQKELIDIKDKQKKAKKLFK